VLIETPDVLDRIPVKPDEVTLLTLTPELRVKQISYWNPDTDSAETIFE